MSRRTKDRRHGPGDLTPTPPSSPVGLLALAIIAVLGITAAAAAVLGTDYDDVTPHGQLLGELQRVAQAQERHYAETGAFAEWTRTLKIPSNDEVRTTLTEGGGDSWEAVSYHPVGLTCTQSGSAQDGVVRTDRPACFMSER